MLESTGQVLHEDEQLLSGDIFGQRGVERRRRGNGGRVLLVCPELVTDRQSGGRWLTNQGGRYVGGRQRRQNWGQAGFGHPTRTLLVDSFHGEHTPFPTVLPKRRMAHIGEPHVAPGAPESVIRLPSKSIRIGEIRSRRVLSLPLPALPRGSNVPLVIRVLLVLVRVDAFFLEPFENGREDVVLQSCVDGCRARAAKARVG